MPFLLLSTTPEPIPTDTLTPLEAQAISFIFFLTIILAIVEILGLIANAVLLSKCGERWWKGLIPFYGKYCVFKWFWNPGVFIAYLVVLFLYVFSGAFLNAGNLMLSLNFASGLVALGLEVFLSERIAYSFGRGLPTIVCLTIFYPFTVFVLCLICREAPELETMGEKYKERNEALREKYKRKELRKSEREKRKREKREKKWEKS